MSGCSACSWGHHPCFPPNCMHPDGPQSHAVRVPVVDPVEALIWCKMGANVTLERLSAPNPNAAEEP